MFKLIGRTCHLEVRFWMVATVLQNLQSDPVVDLGACFSSGGRRIPGTKRVLEAVPFGPEMIENDLLCGLCPN